ncbi:response regulator [Bacteriovorax sp. PP10]|uniref:Response regulator n=1 Tax=Bacteriovorax antarcticus TaxID=3088717 RepID=A0ABU5VXW4_9BACT|nr:response regulator [Bacteriovorax sp. PP10]MEA9356460.1 response regulator [Bacteriovorax sp. PP10]
MKTTPIILIVDDDPDLLDMYQEVIVLEGVKTITALSPKLALECCKNNPGIQVIISDAHMGDVSGMDLLKSLKDYYETIPVFYLLTGAFDINEAEIIKNGARGLILKPFDLNEILERIKKDIKF